MSYQSSCLFSAWWIMVRYLLILWKEEWRQSVTSSLSDCGYTRQPSSFTAPLPDATDADEIWQREVFVQNLAQKYTGWSVSPGHITHTHAWFVEWSNPRGWSALFILHVLVSLLLKNQLCSRLGMYSAAFSCQIVWIRNSNSPVKFETQQAIPAR